jgi:outer membrane protein assembly complex protein YaeT
LRLSSFVVLVLALASPGVWAQEAPAAQASAEQPPAVGAITPYLGLRIEQVEFPGVEPDDTARLLAATPLKIGGTLTREILHDAIQSLFATGRFADIQVEAEHTPPGLTLRFLTVPNYFVGQIAADGVSSNPTSNQLVSASRLQLGELYTREKLDRSLASIQRALEDNGFHNAKVTSSEERNEQQRQVDIAFHVTPGPRAVVGQITLQGDAGYSKDQIEDIGKFHSGDPIISARLARALQRIRAKYQKQDRLLAQVSVAKREYRPERNAVDYALQVDRGPIVEVEAEGYKFSRSELRRLVPIYEEGAVDDDLLNEGRRSLQNRLQTLGYFDATVGVSQHTVQDGRGLRVIYVINPGERHKLAAIRISGNRLFTAEQIRAVMLEQTAGRLFSHGRYSEALLEQDVLNIKGLYRASGYQQAAVASKILEKYQSDPSQVAIDLTIKEGPQTRVAWVRIEGNYLLPSDQLLKFPSTEEGQGFAESNLSEDRDKILGVYFDNGFSNATADVTYVPVVPSPDEFPRVGVTFTIQEGEQFFVNRIFLSGLHFTRPGVARREFRVQPGNALSQQNMLETQRHLYDLGLFNEVDTAVQNPDGTESRKNVLIATQEARRYTFDYGLGFEFQTGQPSVGTNQPLGQTGASPKVSFGLTRINVGGRNQTVTMKTSLSRLQQRGLISFEAPKLLNRDLRFSATAFYDKTVDVSTFTSERTEGSVQTVQVLARDFTGQREVTSIAYRFTFRRVQASNIQVSDNLIPLLSKSTRVGLPNFIYIRNKRDNDLETTRGNYTTIEGGVAASYFGSEADFSRLLVKNATYYAFPRGRRQDRKFVFARATSVGLENPFADTVLIGPAGNVPAGRNLIPLPERFFSGGGNSHRGFGLNQAGPRDPFTGFPLGGSALFLNNLELRFPNITLPYLRDNIGLTAFHDMGNVFDTAQHMLRSLGRWHQPDQQVCFQAPAQGQLSQCNYNYLSHAVGLGVRYQTPIGPLRFDFGYNLNPPAFPSYTNIVVNSVNGKRTGQFGAQRAGRFNFSFSVGQSF